MKYHVANCVCERGKQQLHQVDVTEDAISQKGGIPRQPMHSNAGQLYWNYETLYDVMGLLSLTWSHCITNTFIAALFDFGRTTIDVCLITWLLFDLKHEVKHLLEIETELRCSWSELEFGIYTDRAAAIQFWSIKLFSWSASQTKQGAMLLWYYCVSLQTFVVQLYINRETWCTS